MAGLFPKLTIPKVDLFGSSLNFGRTQTSTPAFIPKRTPAAPVTPPPIPSSSINSQSSLSALTPGQFGAPIIPQVKAPVAATPARPASAPVTPAPTVASTPSTFTTPSGAVVDASGKLITPPTPRITPDAQNATPGASSTQTPAPVPPETQTAISSAEKAFMDAQRISPEEMSTQEDIDKLIESANKAFSNIKGQAIPLEFITGQLKSVEERALGLAEPLERKLARLQAARTSSLESSKFALERADKAADVARETAKTAAEAAKKQKPISVSPGESVIDPETGEVIFQAPEKPDTKAPTTIETAQGIMQWDAASGTWKSTGFAKPVAASTQEKQAEKAEAQKAAQTDVLDSLNLVNTILQAPSADLATITGLKGPRAFVPGTTAQTVKNQVEQLIAKISLENRSKLKGSGAVSDFEAKTLERAGSSLGTNLGNEEFVKQLKQVRGVFTTASGGEAPVIVTNPKTGEVIESTASRDEINALIGEGNVVEYN